MGHISAALVLILAICVRLSLARDPRIPLGEVIWLIGSTVLLFRLGRLSPLFAIIAAPVFAAVLPKLSDRLLTRRPIVAMPVVVLVHRGLSVLRGFPRSDQSLSIWLNRNGPNAPNYPCPPPISSIKTSPHKPAIFCAINWGGFLEWRLAGRFQTLMDGRTQLFTPEFWDKADWVPQPSAANSSPPLPPTPPSCAPPTAHWERFLPD